MTTEAKAPVAKSEAGKPGTASPAGKVAAIATADAPAPKKPTGDPVAYTSTKDVYVDQRYYKAGEVFATNAEPGEHWKKVKPREAAAIEAASDVIPDDAQFDEASVEALQAYALVKRVPIVGIANDRDALITAIKAANEPAL